MANYGTRYVKKKTPWLAFALMLIVFLILGYLISGVYVAPKELKGDYNAQLLWHLHIRLKQQTANRQLGWG